MKTAGRKQKGRSGQQEISRILQERYGLSENDVKSRSMGSQGTDLIMSEAAKKKFPFAPEIKRTERLPLNQALKQAEDNGKIEKLTPVVIFRKNRDKWRVIIDLDTFLDMNDNYSDKYFGLV